MRTAVWDCCAACLAHNDKLLCFLIEPLLAVQTFVRRRRAPTIELVHLLSKPALMS